MASWVVPTRSSLIIVERLFGRIWPSTTKPASPLSGPSTRAINNMSENERSANSDHEAVSRKR